jgi:hypothetical protein
VFKLLPKLAIFWDWSHDRLRIVSEPNSQYRPQSSTNRAQVSAAGL